MGEQFYAATCPISTGFSFSRSTDWYREANELDIHICRKYPYKEKQEAEDNIRWDVSPMAKILHLCPRESPSSTALIGLLLVHHNVMRRRLPARHDDGNDKASQYDQRCQEIGQHYMQ
jgi:hypothetical protein